MSMSSGASSDLTKDDLREFAGEKQSILEENPQLNEEETKTAIITDFVNLLGWEIPQDGNMEYEFGDHNTNRVDYVFFQNGKSKLFVEAKPQGTSLKQKHRSQIREYLVLDNVDLGILTNGEDYEFYRRFVNDDGDIETQRIISISLSDFVDYDALISTFSKTQVRNETYVERLERINELQTAQEQLEEQVEQITDDIIGVITDSIGSIANQPAENHVANYLEKVNEGLAEMTPTSSENGNDPYDVIQEDTAVELRNGEVHFTGEGSARDHLRNVVQVLFGRGHLTVEDLPIEAGPTRYILNTEPVDKKGDEMADSEEVVEGVYLELNANRKTLKQFTKTLLETAKETNEPPGSISSGGESVPTGSDSGFELVDDIVISDETDDPLFPVKNLDSISGAESAKVGVYASDFNRGLPFIADHKAWGFIDIASDPDYFCIYLNRPYQQIQLIGAVTNIVNKDEFIEKREIDRDPEEISESKKAIEFSEVHQLETPIPIGEITSRMQGLLYTTLGDLRTAETTDDL